MDPLPPDVGEVTRLLNAAREGESAALDRLIPLIYDDLRRLARRQLGREYAARTIDPTSPGAGAISGKLYVVGGGADTTLATNQAYTP